MTDRDLDELLRRIEQDPEDRGSLREARALLERLRPDDAALRARLVAAGLRQRPIDELAGAFGAEDVNDTSRAILAPGGGSIMSFDLVWKEDHDGEQRLASSVRLWRRDGRAIGGHEGLMRSIHEGPSWAFSADGRLALIGLRGGIGGGLALCDLQSGGARIFPRDQPEALAVARKPDGRVLTALADSALEVFEVRTSGEARLKLRVPGRFEALAFDTEGDRLAGLRPTGVLEVFVLDRGPEPLITLSFGQASRLSWLKDGALLGLHATAISLFLPKSGALASLEPPDGTFVALASDPAARRLVSADFSGGLTLWDGHSGKILEHRPGAVEGLCDLSIDEQDKRLIAVFEDRSLRAWPW